MTAETVETTAAWRLRSAAEVLAAAAAGETLLVIGRRSRLVHDDVADCLPPGLRSSWSAICAQLLDDPDGVRPATATLSLGKAHDTRIVVAALSEVASRHEAPARPDQVVDIVRTAAADGRPLSALLACEGRDDAIAYAMALARAVPAYTRKTAPGPRRDLSAGFAVADGPVDDRALLAVRDAVADAMRWYDAPAAELTCDALVDIAVQRGRAVGAHVEVLRQSELAEAGFGGFGAVAAASSQQPALVVLRHRPGEPKSVPRPAWIGKGVVYDTGGLSLKRPAEMRGMKGDMGGAGAVLAAFGAAAALGGPPVDAVLCIAENAIGPGAFRPDDIVTMGSGKTVEITDTDCEGRLLLADGLAWAVRHLQPDVLVDLATLTDSAVVATGHRHAAIVCNDEALERTAVAAGRATGELVHPLPYAPATLRPTLGSELADLRNAPDTDAAGASWAAQFLAEHLGAHSGGWLHVDMEGVVRTATGRGTGFGVGLLLRTFAHI